MIVIRLLGYLLAGLGSAPLWESLIKVAFQVEFNFLSEWTGMSVSALQGTGWALFIIGIVMCVFAEIKKPSKEI